MALFNQSTKTWQQVVQEIADSAGASGDTDMTTRAHRSLQASLEYLNAKANWDFLFTEGDPISIIGPSAVTGITASAGQTSAIAPNGHGLLVDDLIGGDPFGAGTRISATSVTGLFFNRPTLSGLPAGSNAYTVTAERDMYPLPSAHKHIYSARLLNAQYTLRLLRRRFYDRSVGDEFTASTPVAYDISLVPHKGKLRLLKPPATADVLLLRYYRRLTVVTASADTSFFDMPQDYEPYAIAWAKWHFLTDKGENERATTWISFAEEGIKTMLGDQNRIPDEDLMFRPGHFTFDPAWGPNSTRFLDWNY